MPLGSGGGDMGSFLADTAPPGITDWVGADSRRVTRDDAVVCDLLWSTQGVIQAPLDGLPCEGCVFVFAVDASFQADLGIAPESPLEEGCATDDYSAIYAWRPDSDVAGALTGLLRWDRAVWVQAGEGSLEGDLLRAELVVDAADGGQRALSVLAVLD